MAFKGDHDCKDKFIPTFKNPDQYATEKIKILKRDFCVHPTDEDEKYIRQFKTEWDINAACREILNKYWE